MLTSTSRVAEERLTPIGKAPDAPPVLITATGLSEYAESFTSDAIAGRSYMAVAIKAAVAQIANAVDTLGTDVGFEQVKAAIKDAVRSTRTKIQTDDGKTKYEDGDKTADYRKFFSMTKAVFGAVHSGRMTRKYFELADNAQHLYDSARELLAGDADTGLPALDWTGEETVAAEEKAERRLARAKAKADEKAAEAAAKLGLTAEQAADLRAKAQELAETEVMAAELEAFEKSASKAAETLAERFGSVIKAQRYVAKMAATLEAMVAQ